MDSYLEELIELVSKMKKKGVNKDLICSTLLYELDLTDFNEADKDELYSKALKFNE